jgi:hypothetical protein
MVLAGAKRAHSRGRERWRATPKQIAEAVESLPEVKKMFIRKYEDRETHKKEPV